MPDEYPVWGKVDAIYTRPELMQHGVWVTGEVSNDPEGGLMFHTDRPVHGNTTGTLVYLAAPDDLAAAFAPLCYQASEKHLKLRLHGAFLPHSGTRDPSRPCINFLIWKIHSASDPDDLPPDQKVTYGPADAIPGYRIVPLKP